MFDKGPSMCICDGFGVCWWIQQRVMLWIWRQVWDFLWTLAIGCPWEYVTAVQNRSEIGRKGADCMVPLGAMSCRNWPNLAVWAQWLFDKHFLTVPSPYLCYWEIKYSLSWLWIALGLEYFSTWIIFFFSPRKTKLGSENLKFQYGNTVRVSCEICDLFVLWLHLFLWFSVPHRPKFSVTDHDFSSERTTSPLGFLVFVQRGMQ